MHISRIAIVAGSLCALSATAIAQVHQVAFDWDASQGGHPKLDTCVAASPNRVLVATNQQIALLTRGGVQKDLIEWGDTGTIFQSTTGFVDPRVDYDPYSGRLWIVMIGGGGVIHVAVAKGSTPDTLTPDDWHVYTGSDVFDLSEIDPMTSTPYAGGADHAVIAFDDDYMWLTSLDAVSPDFKQGIAAFPKLHDGGTSSILDGDPMDGTDLYGILPGDLPGPVDDDFGLFHFAVQELFEDVEEGQFFVAVPEQDPLEPTGFRDAVRLGGAYFDGSGDIQYQWADMAVPASADEYFVGGTDNIWPATPKTGWNIFPTPSASSKFDSGVFARDTSDEPELKIFTAHHVLVSDGGMTPEPEEQTEFRWYVINPDLGNFPGSGWSPTIEVVGRAPAGGVMNAETYQGGIAVNEVGAAYITFTRSGDTGANAWPSLVRASLSSNYTTVLAQLNSVSQTGPAFWYDEGSGPDGDLGSDYTDIQADFLHCGFWATGALVQAVAGTPPAASDIRETWVTEISITCTNAEMTGDGVVDAEDLALYLDYYAKEDPRADMDRSGTITSADYLKYSGEYAKR